MTINQLLKATGETIASLGMEKTNINSVANHAGYNKVLIYRYFGGYNGLIESYFRQFQDRLLLSVQTHPAMSGLTPWEVYALTFYQELQANPGIQALFIWKMVHPKTELALRLNQIQDDALGKLMNEYRPDHILTATFRLLIAGITQIVLSGNQLPDKEVILPLISRVVRAYA